VVDARAVRSAWARRGERNADSQSGGENRRQARTRYALNVKRDRFPNNYGLALTALARQARDLAFHFRSDPGFNQLLFGAHKIGNSTQTAWHNVAQKANVGMSHE
jgi:hypothetical protein